MSQINLYITTVLHMQISYNNFYLTYKLIIKKKGLFTEWIQSPPKNFQDLLTHNIILRNAGWSIWQVCSVTLINLCYLTVPHLWTCWIWRLKYTLGGTTQCLYVKSAKKNSTCVLSSGVLWCLANWSLSSTNLHCMSHSSDLVTV